VAARRIAPSARVVAAAVAPCRVAAVAVGMVVAVVAVAADAVVKARETGARGQ